MDNKSILRLKYNRSMTDAQQDPHTVWLQMEKGSVAREMNGIRNK